MLMLSGGNSERAVTNYFQNRNKGTGYAEFEGRYCVFVNEKMAMKKLLALFAFKLTSEATKKVVHHRMAVLHLLL